MKWRVRVELLAGVDSCEMLDVAARVDRRLAVVVAVIEVRDHLLHEGRRMDEGMFAGAKRGSLVRSFSLAYWRASQAEIVKVRVRMSLPMGAVSSVSKRTGIGHRVAPDDGGKARTWRCKGRPEADRAADAAGRRTGYRR